MLVNNNSRGERAKARFGECLVRMGARRAEEKKEEVKAWRVLCRFSALHQIIG